MYSREVVDKALKLQAQGWTDRTVAEMCGVSTAAVRHWRQGNRRTPDRETARAARANCCPVCHGKEIDAESYAYLLGLYLGDGYIAPLRRVYYLTITCCDDWPQLIELCAEAISRVLPVSVFRVGRTGCTEVKSTSRHWPCIFPQHGTGAKHDRLIQLDEWQCEIVDNHAEAFARGLFHSDGCRVTNRIRRRVGGQWKYYEYPRYFFTNTSNEILGLLGDTLDHLNIEWRYRVQRNDRHQDAGVISVARRDSVARLDSFIGPKS